jgi:hypothetical protein
VALQFADSMLRRFDVDWAASGLTDEDLAELGEHLLRIIQSFVIDPGRPPRLNEDLRDYLRRWVGSALGGASVECPAPPHRASRPPRRCAAGGTPTASPPG